MTSDPSLKLRVGRLENDVVSIYEIITDIRSTQDQHTRRFDGIDQRFEGIDQQLAAIRTTVDGVVTVLDEVVRRLPEPQP